MKRKSLLKKLALGISLLLFATTMSAKNIYVSADGAPTNTGLTPELPKLLGQAVINSAADGDVIIVMGNINLSGTLDIVGKSLTIKGNTCFDKPNQESSASTIDGSTAGQIFNISGDAEVTISNLAFKNATNKAIQIDGTEAALTVNIGYCLFKNNSTANPSTDGPDNGAGVNVIGGATANIFNCWFYDNQAYRGGGLFVDGSVAKVEYCDFKGNFARKRTTLSSSGDLDNNSAGGAIAAAGMYDVNINYCGFTGNYSYTRGGACFPYGDGTFLVQNSYFISNYSGSPRKAYVEGTPDAPSFQPQGDNNGGAFLIYGAGEVVIVNTTIAGNVAYGDARGGAIQHESAASLTLINATVTNNRTDEGNDYHTGGISALAGAKVYIQNSIVERNIAMGGSWWSDVSGYGDATLDVKKSVTGATGWEVVTNYTKDAESQSFGKAEIVSNDGIGDFKNLSGLGDFSINCYPLLPGAYASTLGNPVLLFDFGLTTDQNDKARAASGPIFAGAVELTEPAEGSYVTPGEKPQLYACSAVGIYDIAPDGSDAIAVEYYSILGQKLDKEPANGVFIVKYSNGRSAKVLK